MHPMREFAEKTSRVQARGKGIRSGGKQVLNWD